MKKLCLLLFLLLISGFCVNSFGQESGQQAVRSSEQTKISLDIKGMDIVDVLKMLAQRAGLNIIVGKNVTGRATLFLKNVDIWDAFEIILLANDLAYEKKENIINVMAQRDYELLYGERFQDKKQAKIIQLKHAKAGNLLNSLNQLKTNMGRVVTDEGSNTIVLIDSPAKIKEIERFINDVDLPVETRVFSLNYGQADKISEKLKEAITKGVGSIKIDERTNKIAITDFPEKLDEFARVISAFDEKTPQVLIDAQIIEISPQKDQFTMGVDWDYWLKKNVRLIGSLPAPAVADIASIPNKLSIGVAAATGTVTERGQYKSILNLLQVIGRTKILSSPRIMALNNQEAKILVGTKEAYITSATSQTGQTAVTSQSVNFVDVGIKLYVTPTINREGFVTMKIKPEVSSSVPANLKSEDKTTQVPIVTTSETETTIMVKDGTTIIIAGLKKDKKIKEVQKIPVLGDMPLVGYFFKNIKDEVIKTELVIFITPHIVSGEEPLEYTSITKDKDIAYLQTLAKTQSREKSNSLGNEKMTVAEYYQLIINKINRFAKLNSPEGKKGEVNLNFSVSSNGNLVNEPFILQTDNSTLNQFAIKAIKDATPFPPFPKELEKQEESFRIALEYK